LTRSGNPLSQARAVAALSRVLRLESADLIHTHTAAGGLVGRVAARIAGTPHVVHTIHGLHNLGGGPVRAALFNAVEKWGAAHSDFVFVQNERDRKTVQGWRVTPHDHVWNIGNGIDLARFDPDRISPEARRRLKRELGLRPTARIVTFIGRPTRDKGALDVAEVARRLWEANVDAQLLCVVPDLPGERRSALPALERAAARYELRMTCFRRDIPALLAISDVFLLLSRYEGLSKSLIEAMAMEVPAVTTNVRGCSDLVEEGGTGFLVKPGDLDATVRQIRHLLDNPERAHAMGKRARNRALRDHGEGAMLETQVGIIRSLLRSPGMAVD
jgi:glycosyltransferase involved in cell wall biosynthesis